MDERIMALAFAGSLVPTLPIVVQPQALAFSYSLTTTQETPLPRGVLPVKLLGEVSGAVAIGAESVTGIAKGAIQWLQVASKLPVDKDADDLVARRLTELTNSLGSRPIPRTHKG